jgi:BirA family biotin operon repressor/biotin-[acetyl-CoA-carboxylase] ligase
MAGDSGISHWAAAIAAMCAEQSIQIARQAIVLSETTSTQDAAWEASGGRPGTLCIADTQSSGRGRLGRAWTHAPGQGLACTFTISTAMLAPEALALAAGVAVAQAVERSAGLPELGLRWPNDVVERGATGRKIAGVLIERRGDVALVGIGVNVGQREEDWPPQLRGRAASIAMLTNAPPDRLNVLLSLIARLDSVLRGSSEETLREWQKRDVLLGTSRKFLYDGRVVAGRVLALDPLHFITVRTESDERVRLPALATSLVHEP